jgi:uncharacterized membrane protein YvbJ
MVYCPRCGTLNDDSAEFCVKCGAPLRTGTYESRRHERRRAQNECFGLPHGGAIVGLAIGIIIIIWALFTFLGISAAANLWYAVVILIGVLLIAAAIYSISRPRPRPSQA